MGLHGSVRHLIGDEPRFCNVICFGKTFIRVAEGMVIVLL
jgi:hypothetical protein